MHTPITELLQRVAEGDRRAFDEAFERLYPELRRIARARVYEAGSRVAMGTTSLLHESFLRLVQAAQLRPENRRHFFALASRCMRQTLIDELRQAHAERRGGGQAAWTLPEGEALDALLPQDDERTQQLHEALQALERLDPQLSEVADLRWFGGFTEAEIAELQGVDERTVRRRWTKARAFLLAMLDESGAA